MRFVSPETVRIDLGNGDWIEVKKELSVGDEKRLLSSGFKRASASNEIDVDWAVRAMARVEAYLVRWSATDDKGREVTVTRSAIESLASEDFEAIDRAIQAHQAAVSEEKKAKSGTPTSTVA